MAAAHSRPPPAPLARQGVWCKTSWCRFSRPLAYSEFPVNLPLFFFSPAFLAPLHYISGSRFSFFPFSSFLFFFKVPTEEQTRHARHVPTAAINKLEELWQDDPNATLEDVDKPGVDDEAQPTLARYEDGYHFQNVLAPLVSDGEDE